MITVEIPADLAPGFTALAGQGGYVPIFRSQDTHLAPRRVNSMNGNMVVCESDLVTTAFYRYSIDLRPRSVQSSTGHDHLDITRPTPAFGG